jgi:hypothetical protein
MPYKLGRFCSRPDILRGIAPENLSALLADHAESLAADGLTLPVMGTALGFNYDLLTSLMMKPDKFPPELREAFYFIHQMATPEGMECLLDAAERAEPPIEIVGKPAPTPGDVAVQVWLKNRELLESKHAEQFTESVRSFYSFGTAIMPVPQPRDPVAVIDEIKNDLDDFFEKKKRNRHTKIFPYIQDDSTMFLVRHGDPFERKSTITERGDSAGVYYWPEKFDVLVLDPVGGELRIHARSKGEVDEYRRIFGRHLYSGGFFSSENVYTLEPLQTIGEDSITPICGMERVVLIEAHFSWGNRRHTSVTQKDPDIFAAYRTGILQPPIAARITKARFRITFTGSPKPRTVTIKLPNEAQYMRDDDGVIVERWLRERGFIVKPGKMKTGQAPHEPTHYDPAA